MLKYILSFFRKNSFTPVYKKDSHTGGYIAYFKEYEGIVGQGETEAAALADLKKDLEIVTKLKEKKDPKSDSEHSYGKQVAQSFK